jgi:hypothetical protein
LPTDPGDADAVTGYVSLSNSTSRTNLYSGAALGGDQDVKLWYDDLEMTDISFAVPKTAQRQRISSPSSSPA